MKAFLNLKLALILASVAMAGTSFASFPLKNTSGGKVTLLMDYNHKPYFDVVRLNNNQAANISYGLARIIAYKGDQRIPNIVEKKLEKTKNYPSMGSFVLDKVVGNDYAREQPSEFLSIEKDMHTFHKVVPSWRIIELPNKKVRSLALWRIE